jgi:predicted TIM-barrel fold metal-dependent hydrolase
LSSIKALDVHAHFLPAPYIAALHLAGVTAVDNGLPIPHWDVGQAIEAMDRGDIGCAMLSISSPFVHFVDQGQTVSLCMAINDAAAEVVAAHSERFGAMMILPLPDIAASLAELERAFDTLGLEGVCIPSNARGLYPGDAKMFPLLSELDRRKATVFVHPTTPCCFDAFNLSLPAPFIEFPFETTRAVASLLFGGALSMFPNIRYIVPHAGGTIPFLESRISGAGASRYVEAPRDREETRRMLAALYYDTVTAAQIQFDALRALAPISNIVFGSDYPWNPSAPSSMTAAFRQLDLNENDQTMILQGNAMKLFPGLHSRCFGK